MDYAKNRSLRDNHPRGEKVPLATVVTYVQQVAAALQYAHDKKITYCDVKPENLLLDERGCVLLSDFGIASRRTTTVDPHIEQDVSKIRGTYAYMAPEQFHELPRAASDQYALAVVVYEWLSGELPFDPPEPTYERWFYLHRHVPPQKLRDKVPTLSVEVEQAVLKALSKNARERFDTVQDFATALEKAARGEPTPLPEPSPVPPTALPHAQTSTAAAPSRVDPIKRFYLIAEAAEKRGEIQAAYRDYQQVVTMPNPSNSVYAKRAKRAVQKLRPQLILPLISEARAASEQGRWQKEINAWERLQTYPHPEKRSEASSFSKYQSSNDSQHVHLQSRTGLIK